MGAPTSSRGRKKAIAEINVTPLVDVVLVLLIIIMVVAQLDAESPEQGVPVELPGAATAESLDAEVPLTVAVRPDGSLVLSGTVAGRDVVRDAVRLELRRRGADTEIVVAADGRASHARFVALIDLLRAEGVRRFAIQTDPQAGEPTDGG